MITPLLEKAIAKGQATYSKFTHAMGMFSSVPIPDGKTVIITDVKWNHFLNPYTNDPNTSIKDVFKFNEYQLKVDGKKSLNIMHFRNTVNMILGITQIYDWAGPFGDIITDPFSPFFFPDPPILQDVFFICEEYIKLTVSRNVFMDTSSSTGNYGLLNGSVAEQPMPNGVANEPVLKRLQMNTAAPIATMYYTPPGNKYAGLSNPAGDRNTQSYQQDINALSQIYAPDTGATAQMGFPYISQPLVELGLVTINTNHFDNLANQ